MEKKDEEKSIMEEEEVKDRIPVIRIKIPPKVVDDEEEVKRHYCKSCDKSFSSGKALGGHMSSAHVQANKDYNSSVKKMRKSYSGSEDNACNICGKLFHSKKSLFGHMRCHPERFWRGMEPPQQQQQQQEQQDPEDSELGRLKDWPSANKRGRGGGPVLSIMDKEKETSTDESDTSDELYMNAINFLMSIKPAPSTTPDKYKCDLCNRVFLTHQALGGHRSSHNKFKMTIINTNNRPSPDKDKKKKKEKKDKDKGQSSSPAASVFDIDLNQIPADEDDKEEMPDTPSNS